MTLLNVTEDVLKIIRDFNTKNKLIENRLLILDNDLEFAKELETLLDSTKFKVLISNTLWDISPILVNYKPDFIIVNLGIEPQELFSVLYTLRSETSYAYIPVFGVTDVTEGDVELKALALGLNDIIFKPINTDKFLLKIKNTLEITNVYRTESLVDHLTGLPNRKHFLNVLDDRLLNYTISDKIFTIAFLDLDKFKRVNDTYGHSCGDYVLKQFASYVTKNIPENVTFARYGGEEFVTILDNVDANQTKEIMHSLKEGFKSSNLTWEGNNITQTFSSGVYTPSGIILNRDILINRADKAVYHAKETGRDKIVIWDTSIC